MYILRVYKERYPGKMVTIIQRKNLSTSCLFLLLYSFILAVSGSYDYSTSEVFAGEFAGEKHDTESPLSNQRRNLLKRSKSRSTLEENSVGEETEKTNPKIQRKSKSQRKRKFKRFAVSESIEDATSTINSTEDFFNATNNTSTTKSTNDGGKSLKITNSTNEKNNGSTNVINLKQENKTPKKNEEHRPKISGFRRMISMIPMKLVQLIGDTMKKKSANPQPLPGVELTIDEKKILKNFVQRIDHYLNHSKEENKDQMKENVSLSEKDKDKKNEENEKSENEHENEENEKSANENENEEEKSDNENETDAKKPETDKKNEEKEDEKKENKEKNEEKVDENKEKKEKNEEKVDENKEKKEKNEEKKEKNEEKKEKNEKKKDDFEKFEENNQSTSIVSSSSSDTELFQIIPDVFLPKKNNGIIEGKIFPWKALTSSQYTKEVSMQEGSNKTKTAKETKSKLSFLYVSDSSTKPKNQENLENLSSKVYDVKILSKDHEKDNKNESYKLIEQNIFKNNEINENNTIYGMFDTTLWLLNKILSFDLF